MSSLERAYNKILDFQSQDTKSLFVRGDGQYLYDLEGKAYLDFKANAGTALLGHFQPALVDAIVDQASKIMSRDLNNPSKPELDLEEYLSREIFGEKFQLAFSQTHEEALDTALQVALCHHPERFNVLSFLSPAKQKNGIIGKMLSKPALFSNRISPRLVFPQIHHFQMPVDQTSFESLKRNLEHFFNTICSPHNVACCFVESFGLDEGMHFPLDLFFGALTQLKREYGILTFLDESHTSFGRIGSRFSYQERAFEPDAVLVETCLGLPLSILALDKSICVDYPENIPSNLGPLNAAVALAGLKILGKKAVRENILFWGERVRKRLESRFGEHLQVRGKGLLIGIEAKSNGFDLNSLLLRARLKGLLIGHCQLAKNVIYLTPPLLVNESSLDEALYILEQIIDYELLLSSK